MPAAGSSGRRNFLQHTIDHAHMNVRSGPVHIHRLRAFGVPVAGTACL